VRVACAAHFLIGADGLAAAIALPALQGDLGVAAIDAQWGLTAYGLAFGGALLLGGCLGDLYGRRRLLVCGMAAFAAGSLLAGLSPTLPVSRRGSSGAGARVRCCRPRGARADREPRPAGPGAHARPVPAGRPRQRRHHDRTAARRCGDGSARMALGLPAHSAAGGARRGSVRSTRARDEAAPQPLESCGLRVGGHEQPDAEAVLGDRRRLAAHRRQQLVDHAAIAAGLGLDETDVLA
jgi:hypothetical protein